MVVSLVYTLPIFFFESEDSVPFPNNIFENKLTNNQFYYS